MDQQKALKQLHELKRLKGNFRLAAEGWNSKWKTLISTLLSARTRDETTIKISRNLYKKYPNAKSLAKANIGYVKKIIKPINFYKTKSRKIIECSRIISEKYNGNIPNDFDKLIKLPGVGRKTANVFLAEQGMQTIGVDTHTAHISRALGWTRNNNPHKIENDLKKLFPKSKWRSINYILVGFGRKYRGKMRGEVLKRISSR